MIETVVGKKPYKMQRITFDSEEWTLMKPNTKNPYLRHKNNTMILNSKGNHPRYPLIICAYCKRKMTNRGTKLKPIWKCPKCSREHQETTLSLITKYTPDFHEIRDKYLSREDREFIARRKLHEFRDEREKSKYIDIYKEDNDFRNCEEYHIMNPGSPEEFDDFKGWLPSLSMELVKLIHWMGKGIHLYGLMGNGKKEIVDRAKEIKYRIWEGVKKEIGEDIPITRGYIDVDFVSKSVKGSNKKCFVYSCINGTEEIKPDYLINLKRKFPNKDNIFEIAVFHSSVNNGYIINGVEVRNIDNFIKAFKKIPGIKSVKKFITMVKNPIIGIDNGIPPIYMIRVKFND